MSIFIDQDFSPQSPKEDGSKFKASLGEGDFENMAILYPQQENWYPVLMRRKDTLIWIKKDIEEETTEWPEWIQSISEEIKENIIIPTVFAFGKEEGLIIEKAKGNNLYSNSNYYSAEKIDSIPLEKRVSIARGLIGFIGLMNHKKRLFAEMHPRHFSISEKGLWILDPSGLDYPSKGDEAINSRVELYTGGAYDEKEKLFGEITGQTINYLSTIMTILQPGFWIRRSNDKSMEEHIRDSFKLITNPRVQEIFRKLVSSLKDDCELKDLIDILR